MFSVMCVIKYIKQFILYYYITCIKYIIVSIFVKTAHLLVVGG